MSRRPVHASTALLCALALTSCAAAPPTAPAVALKDRPPIPVDLLTCTAAPPVPDLLPDDAALALLMAGIWDAWADCHDKLGQILDWQQEDDAKKN